MPVVYWRMAAGPRVASPASAVRESVRLPVAATLSCYDPLGTAAAPVHCGRCDACLLRKKGFAEAKLTDPTTYAA